MEPVHFRLSDTFQRVATTIVEQIACLVRADVPDADVQDIGATSIPGLLTKGDVDVNVRVATSDFGGLVESLSRRFDVHQPENWNDGYASFVDDATYELPVGVQVTIIGHPEDKFVAQRDRLAGDPGLIARYNDLKAHYEGRDMDDYRTAKWAFIEAHLEAL